MAHYLNGKLVADDHDSMKNAIHVHKYCAEWYAIWNSLSSLFHQLIASHCSFTYLSVCIVSIKLKENEYHIANSIFPPANIFTEAFTSTSILICVYCLIITMQISSCYFFCNIKQSNSIHLLQGA